MSIHSVGTRDVSNKRGKGRALMPLVERLEARQLLSTTAGGEEERAGVGESAWHCSDPAFCLLSEEAAKPAIPLPP